MCKGDSTGNLFPQRRVLCDLVLMGKIYIFPTKIDVPVTQIYGDGLKRLQHVRKWCRVFKSSWADIKMITSVDPAKRS